jgi:hypothetical protein
MSHHRKSFTTIRQDPPVGFGQYYRGFHVPRSGRLGLPPHLLHSFFRPFGELTGGEPYAETIAFDNLIYIRESTSSDVTGCVTTYAHELQHFMQHGHTSRLWDVNRALYYNLGAFEPNALTTDIPTERDAEIKSKRVAEILCGVEAVKELAEKQVRLMEEAGEGGQRGKWAFFRDVPSSTNYNLLEATIPFVEKYKGRIDFGTDVNRPEWWLRPLEDDE